MLTPFDVERPNVKWSEGFDGVDTTQSMDEILGEVLYPVYADAVWHDNNNRFI